MSVLMKARRRAWLYGVVALAVVAAGCTSGAGSGTGNGADTVESFNIALGAKPNSLDITKHFDAVNMGTMSLFTEPLERLASDGSTSPNLATKVSQPDDTTIVYTLRDDVKFSNGDPLTPADVVWSIEHVTDAKAGAQTSSILSSVDRVTEAGENKVRVLLGHPDPRARQVLALTALVQNAEYAQAHKSDLGAPAAVPVGTGPYRVTKFGTDAVTMDRNPNYWGKKPVADTVTISYIATDNSAQLAMRSGEIQGALVGDATSVSRWKAIDDSTVYSSPALLSHYLCLDTTVAPFDDIHVRKAIAHAIDRKGLLKAAFGNNASVLPALVPAAELEPVAPSKEAVTSFLDGLPSYEFDLDEARAELAKSAHPDGFSVSIPYVSEEVWSKLTVLNLKENLKPLGITVKPKAMTMQEWVDAVFAHKSTPVWPMSLAAPSPDPGSLPRVMTKKAITAPGGYNFAKWAPADLQDDAKTLETSTDNAARWRASQQILTAIAQDVPYLPLFQPKYTLVLGEGFAFKDTPGIIEVASGSWMNEVELT